MEPKNKPHAVQCADAWLKDAGKPTYSDLLVALQQVRTETLEQAAKVCEEMGDHWAAYKDTALLNGDVELSNVASGEPRAADFLAKAIRNLAGTRPAANAVRVPDQAGFEAWATSHSGLPLDRAGDALRTDDGLHFPTYKFGRTEIAWRAWANRPAAADAGRLSKNAVGAVPSSIAAVLPNGVAVTNVYDAYAAGLEQAAKDRAPATSAAALPDFGPLYSTRQDADRWRTMVRLTLDDTMVDLVEAEIAKRPARDGLTDTELQEEMVACLTAAIDAARQDTRAAKGAAGLEGGEA